MKKTKTTATILNDTTAHKTNKTSRGGTHTETTRSHPRRNYTTTIEASKIQLQHDMAARPKFRTIITQAIPDTRMATRSGQNRKQTTRGNNIQRQNKIPYNRRRQMRPRTPQTETPPPQTTCLLYTSPSPRDRTRSRMPSSA